MVDGSSPRRSSTPISRAIPTTRRGARAGRTGVLHHRDEDPGRLPGRSAPHLARPGRPARAAPALQSRRAAAIRPGLTCRASRSAAKAATRRAKRRSRIALGEPASTAAAASRSSSPPSARCRPAAGCGSSTAPPARPSIVRHQAAGIAPPAASPGSGCQRVSRIAMSREPAADRRPHRPGHPGPRHLQLVPARHLDAAAHRRPLEGVEIADRAEHRLDRRLDVLALGKLHCPARARPAPLPASPACNPAAAGSHAAALNPAGPQPSSAAGTRRSRRGVAPASAVERPSSASATSSRRIHIAASISLGSTAIAGRSAPRPGSRTSARPGTARAARRDSRRGRPSPRSPRTTSRRTAASSVSPGSTKPASSEIHPLGPGGVAAQQHRSCHG